MGKYGLAADFSAPSVRRLPRIRLTLDRGQRSPERNYTVSIDGTRFTLVLTMLLRHEGFRRLCLARDLLREQCEPAPSIAELARVVQISPFHFIRQFRAVFGVTPHQFRTAVRIDRAKELLSRGEMSVTEVCMELGFSSVGSFSDLFARRVGTPPSSYRRRTRALVALPPNAPCSLTPGCLTLMAAALSQFPRS